MQNGPHSHRPYIQPAIGGRTVVVRLVGTLQEQLALNTAASDFNKERF